jgi:hypothetical protein
VLAACALLGACTSSNSPNSPSGSTRVSTVAHTPDSAPIDTGPTHAASASACRVAPADTFVRDTIGMRLGRLTVLRSGGRVVGCRFYALQDSALHNSEHLPGPKQPILEITTQRYRTALDAHNAFVTLGTASKHVQRADLGRTTGVCFQVDFYPKDHGTDWACAASVGRTEVVVRTVDNTGSFNAITLTKAVLRRV